MSSSPVEDEITLRIQEAWEAGRAAWPKVNLAAERFEAHLRTCLAGALDAAALARLHCVDLYLACACLHDAPGAIAEFERVLLVHVAQFVRRVDPSPAFADEVRQLLREKLFVASESHPPRIADYAGTGPLLSWLRVTAVRSALNLRRDGGFARQDQLDEAVMAAASHRDTELELIKQRYQDEFQRAVREAFAQLPEDQRTVMRLHLVAGLTTARIAPMFQVNQSTVVRWMAAARLAVRERTRERLRERLNLSPPEFESLVALMLSRLDLSLATSMGTS